MADDSPKPAPSAGRREYSADEKAHVMAALLAGQGVGDVARTYKIPEGTVKAWKTQAKQQLASNGPIASRRDQIGELLVTYLAETLETLAFQQINVFRNRAWLAKQDAQQMAVLHGVLADKAVRLLEALGGAGPLPEPPDPSGPPDPGAWAAPGEPAGAATAPVATVTG